MEEQRKWKNVNNEEGRNNYREQKKEMKRATDKAKKGCHGSICDRIMELQRTGHYDLMCVNTKGLCWKGNVIQMTGIDCSQGNIIMNQN
jgi:ribosomal protein L32